MDALLVLLVAALIALPVSGQILRVVVSVLAKLVAGAVLIAFVIIVLAALATHGALA